MKFVLRWFSLVYWVIYILCIFFVLFFSWECLEFIWFDIWGSGCVGRLSYWVFSCVVFCCGRYKFCNVFWNISYVLVWFLVIIFNFYVLGFICFLNVYFIVVCVVLCIIYVILFLVIGEYEDILFIYFFYELCLFIYVFCWMCIFFVIFFFRMMFLFC